MTFRLKDRLLTKSGALTKVFDVDICPGSGWKMELAHMTREGFDRIIKKHTRQVYQKGIDGMRDKTDLDGLYSDYADKIIVGWTGLTIETLKTLVAFDATGTKDADEIPYDHETCVSLLKGAQHLDTWITSVASNPGRFQNAAENGKEDAELKKLIAFGLWRLDKRIPECKLCAEKFWDFKLIAVYGNPPCFRCKIPELMPQNFLAWQVFTVCSSQMLVVGMGSPLGIRFEAIQIALDIVGVHPDERTGIFEKVRHLGLAYAAMWNERIEAERPKQDRTPKRGADIPPMYSPDEWKKRMAAWDGEDIEV